MFWRHIPEPPSSISRKMASYYKKLKIRAYFGGALKRNPSRGYQTVCRTRIHSRTPESVAPRTRFLDRGGRAGVQKRGRSGGVQGQLPEESQAGRGTSHKWRDVLAPSAMLQPAFRMLSLE